MSDEPLIGSCSICGYLAYVEAGWEARNGKRRLVYRCEEHGGTIKTRLVDAETALKPISLPVVVLAGGPMRREAPQRAQEQKRKSVDSIRIPHWPIRFGRGA